MFQKVKLAKGLKGHLGTRFKKDNIKDGWIVHE
jgi:hypothetical protein